MKRFSLLFILVFAVAAFGQEAMEAPAEEMADSMAVEMAADTAAVDTMAMDEMLMTDSTAVEEAAMEEDAGDALEAMLAEEGTMETEVTSGSALIGYTAGVMGGYPVWLSSGMGDREGAPVYGLVIGSPFGFQLGPFELGVGAEFSLYDFGSGMKGVALLATLNTAVFETPQGPISVELGGGYYGSSVGATAGVTYTYAVPNLPLVVKPYLRANASLDAGAELGGGASNNAVSWINAGLYVSYDISTLF